MCLLKFVLLAAFALCNGSPVLIDVIMTSRFNYTIFTGKSDSMFGFTVALHRDKNNKGWVLVGAPKAQSSFQDSNLVSNGGAVYRCQIDNSDVCEEVQFDRENYNSSEFGGPIDQKSHQWFGATLTTSGQVGGPVVACAPRYVWFTEKLNRRDPIGTCFVSDGDFQNSREYSPCRTREYGYHRQGSCQAGISAALNKAGDRLFVGAPGGYYWQGQLFSIDAQATFNFTIGNKTYGAKGTVVQQNLETKPPVFSTEEGSSNSDDSYTGYSMITGHFREGEEFEGIAVGVPKADNLRGKVRLFTWDLKNYKNITIENSIGSYFGYSITAADVNGDKKLDIIVGAPMYTEKNNRLIYDVGRVYIFYQSSNPNESFTAFHIIHGTESRARFGHAMSSLGDINRDGFDEFAISAPYGGRDGRGVVYVYTSSAKGPEKGHVLRGKMVEPHIAVKAFGFSIVGGMDINGDGSKDVAIGSLSDSVFFFRNFY